MAIQSVGGNPSFSGVSENTRSTAPAQAIDAPKADAVQKPAAVKQTPPAQLNTVIEKLNQSMRQNNTQVEFSVDKATKMDVVKMVDSDTGEVIRQYPSEETLAIAEAIDQGTKQGALVNQKA